MLAHLKKTAITLLVTMRWTLNDDDNDRLVHLPITVIVSLIMIMMVDYSLNRNHHSTWYRKRPHIADYDEVDPQWWWQSKWKTCPPPANYSDCVTDGWATLSSVGGICAAVWLELRFILWRVYGRPKKICKCICMKVKSCMVNTMDVAIHNWCSRRHSPISNSVTAIRQPRRQHAIIALKTLKHFKS